MTVIRTPEYGWQGQMKFLKIQLIWNNMFRQNFKKVFWFRQALAYNDKICSDWPRGLKKAQICSDRDIRPWKQPNSFRLANQASKTTHFVWNSFKIADLMMPKCKYITTNLILCIHPISSMCCTMGFLANHHNLPTKYLEVCFATRWRCYEP